MRIVIINLMFFCFFEQLVCQSKSPYIDIANELLVRKKLSSKLPDVFDDVKFAEVVSKLDNIAQIKPTSQIDHINITNPEFHWCYSQTYLLAGKPVESLDHYRQYKIQVNSNNSIHPLFNNPINELELALEKQQADLAYAIYFIINNFKSMTSPPENIQIIDLQIKLNVYNELAITPIFISEDGIIGPQTKSAIYDFEENNPYFVTESEIENSNLKGIEIASLPHSIRPVSALKEVSNLDNETKFIDIPHNNSIELSTNIILDEAKIKSIPGNSIAEVLEYIIGLDVKRNGYSDASANVSTFGGTGEQTLILIDGLKISNQQTLNHDLDLPININDIKQIEIMQNAAARQYGTGAISGVINIITKSGNESKSYFATEYGDYELINGKVAINIPIGKSYNNISFSNISSTGYQDNTDFIKRTFYYKYSIQDGKSLTNFSFGYLLRGNGINNKMSLENQYENNSTKFFNSKIIWNFDQIKFESNMHWFDHRDELAYDKNSAGWYNYSNTEIGIHFKSSINWNLGISSPRFTYTRELNSTDLVKEIERDHYSLSLQHNFSINKLNVEFGISGNYYSDFEWFAAPGYQLVYNINNNANIFHRFDHGFRLPSFFEMYAEDYIYNGNDNLNGESINSFEYGIQIYGSAMEMTISHCYKNSQNVIDWHPLIIGSSYWEATNIPDVLTSGSNVRIELYPEIIKLLRFVDRFELGYAHIDLQHNGQEDEYKYITHYLKHQITFGTQYNLPLGISRSWYVRYEQPTSYDNRTIVDTQIHHKIWRIESTLNINNLFDVQYEDIENVALPGRWISFNFRFNL